MTNLDNFYAFKSTCENSENDIGSSSFGMFLGIVVLLVIIGILGS